jgi:hypothetical protein
MGIPKLEHLQPWTDYWRGKPLLFSTPAKARSFIDTRRNRMEKMGILVVTTLGFLVDYAELDRHLLDLLKSVDGGEAE